jgi:hypothetical protein
MDWRNALGSPDPGPIPDTCSAELAAKTVRIHIPSDFFDLLAGTTDKSSICSAGPSCISYADTKALQEWTPGKPVVSETYLQDAGLSGVATPLDVDLEQPTDSNGNSVAFWDDPASPKPVQIQIVLDDPSNMQFITDASGSTALTVMQGSGGPKKFSCISKEIGIDPGTGNASAMISLQVTRAQPTDHNYGKYDGLNIGVKFTLGGGWFMPIFIDPQVRNNGG